VRLTLHASAEAMRKRVPNWGPPPPFEPVDDERCEYRTGDDNLDWLCARIMMLGVDFDVDGPPELVEHLVVLGQRLGRLGR
jgi:hypothetical protein